MALIAEICPISSLCGNCGLAAVPYQQQLDQKKSRLEKELKQRRLYNAPVTIHPSPRQIEYRRRVLLRCHLTKDHFKIGFFSEATRHLAAIEDCPISTKPIRQFLHWCHQQFQNPQHRLALASNFEEERFRLLVQSTAVGSTTELSIVITPAQKNSTALEPLVERLNHAPHCVVQTSKAAATSTAFFSADQEESIEYFFKADSFQQTNEPGNLTLRSLVRSYVKESRANSVADLYCGNGNLSLGLGPDISVYGCDTAASAVQAARQSCRLAGVKAQLEKKSAQAGLQRALELGSQFLILDPPRIGLENLAAPIGKSQIPYIALVSCQLKSFYHDIDVLSQNYRIDSLAAIDLFPHTQHLEVVAFLVNNDQEIVG